MWAGLTQSSPSAGPATNEILVSAVYPGSELGSVIDFVPGKGDGSRFAGVPATLGIELNTPHPHPHPHPTRRLRRQTELQMSMLGQV